MRIRSLRLGCALLSALPLALFAQASPTPQAFRKDIPAKIDQSARYLVYLHGKIIEDKGIRPTDPRFGLYEYEEIVAALEKKGFTVITEARAKDTDPKVYAAKVVDQLNTLLKAGVAPDRITIVGASKGAVIAMLVSTSLKNSKANFVIMATCNDWLAKNFEIDLHGNILSIYDKNDEFGRTCQQFFDKATGLGRHKEVELQLGIGHALLYRPFKEWVDLVDDWAKPGASNQ